MHLEGFMVLWEEQLLQELHFNSHFLSLPCCSWVLLSPSCDVADLAFLHACAEAAKWFFPCDELIITYSTFVNAWSLQITPEWKNKSLIGGLSLSTVRCGFLNVCLSDIAVITILWAWADQVELHLAGAGKTKTKSSGVFFFLKGNKTLQLLLVFRADVMDGFCAYFDLTEIT